MKSRVLLVIAVAGVAVAATGAVAWAGAGSGPKDPQPANAHRTVTTATALDTSTESKYTPITPCRAVNTAAAGTAGLLRDGSHKLYFIGGTSGFADQGGHSGGCGVPVDATAVTATITATASARGYLKVWPAGTTEPSTSFMNYTNLFLVAVGGTAGVGSEGRIAVRNHAGPTQIAVDVTGYYLKPMAAEVSSAGALTHGSRVTGVTKLPGSGVYQVDFDRNVTGCTYAATSFFFNVTIETQPRSGDPDGVFVETASGGTGTDETFYLTVTC